MWRAEYEDGVCLEEGRNLRLDQAPIAGLKRVYICRGGRNHYIDIHLPVVRIRHTTEKVVSLIHGINDGTFPDVKKESVEMVLEGDIYLRLDIYKGSGDAHCTIRPATNVHNW